MTAPPADESADDDAGDSSGGTDRPADGRREVVVPLRLYKTVTVFSTLIAIGLVVGGFVLLDAATNRGRAPLNQADAWLLLLGLGCIAAGAVVYAFSGRFRTAEMGAADDGSDAE